MSSDDIAITVHQVSKTFRIFSEPRHRILQGLFRGKRSYFREKAALQDVSFTVPRGQIVGIVGANGAGKTTLLSVVCGTTTPSAGHVDVSGRVASLLDLGTGFNPEMTGFENLIFVGAIRGFTRREVESRLPDIIAFADIGEAINQEVKFYSTGMYMRLAFSLCIHLDPDILVVDEALAVGDEAFQRKCYSRLRALRGRGTTILFVSHSSPLIVELCDAAILMDQGQLLVQGDPKHVVGHYQKLLYAPASEQDNIRGQIRAGIAPADILNPDEVTPLHDFFDASLVAPPSARYPNRGAILSAPVLINDDNRRVNLVEARTSLTYRFQVRFERDARAVRFGMMIKSITGLELGGRETSDIAREVCAGEVLDVAFRFNCSLNPGAYFLNAGVLALDENDDEEIYLDRIIDALQFRVLPNRHHQTGAADLGIDVSVSHTVASQGARVTSK